MLLDHDGSWDDITDRVRQLRDYAIAEVAAGSSPPVLVINSISQLSDITRAGAAAHMLCSDAAAEIHAADPHAGVKPEGGHWNQANARWKYLMGLLMEFPGIVLATSRADTFSGVEEETTAFRALYRRPDLPNQLLFQVSACVHLRSGENPLLVVAKNQRLRGELPRELPGMTIASLIYEHLEIDPAAVATRVLRVPVEAMQVQLFTAANLEQLRVMFEEFVARLGREDPTLLTAYTRRRQHLRIELAAHQLRDAATIPILEGRYIEVADEVGKDKPIVNRAYDQRRHILLKRLARRLDTAANLEELKSLYNEIVAEVGEKLPEINRAANARRMKLESSNSASHPSASADPENVEPPAAVADTGKVAVTHAA
ncbi:hypothetical protein [Nocardia sp. XZ_19_369]|uniref:hypothetical protein n=1 Tax=Nocardia sp. XZ_19_369 TaxID=2769487 RepID=UPI001E5A6D2C|nr:hypothetical protein [Nocardia sp. XZ_19_369]